ncbi:MAG: MBL fold metallo-hydrolase [Ectothiorhodospiraceae bacterium]
MLNQTLPKAFLLTACGVGLTLGVHAGELGRYTSNADGFNTHTYYYDDGEEVTLFDTQFLPTFTQAMVDQIREETDSPITRVVVTHPNPDKFNGLPLLHDLGATSIASEATAEAMPAVHEYKKRYWVEEAGAFEPGEYPDFESVQKTFTGEQTIELDSGETITLIELEHSAIASNQTVARIDATGDLIVGDMVHHKAHAWLEGGLVDGEPQPDLDAWRQALRELEAIDADRVHGGRGESASLDEAVAEQIRYLNGVEAEVRRYIEEHPDLEQALDDPERAQDHYQAIQERVAARFPDYELPYMVGYSVYSLVRSLVAVRDS